MARARSRRKRANTRIKRTRTQRRTKARVSRKRRVSRRRYIKKQDGGLFDKTRRSIGRMRQNRRDNLAGGVKVQMVKELRDNFHSFNASNVWAEYKALIASKYLNLEIVSRDFWEKKGCPKVHEWIKSKKKINEMWPTGIARCEREFIGIVNAIKTEFSDNESEKQYDMYISLLRKIRDTNKYSWECVDSQITTQMNRPSSSNDFKVYHEKLRTHMDKIIDKDIELFKMKNVGRSPISYMRFWNEDMKGNKLYSPEDELLATQKIQGMVEAEKAKKTPEPDSESPKEQEASEKITAPEDPASQGPSHTGEIIKDLNVEGNLNVGENLNVEKDLSVAGNMHISGDLVISGNIIENTPP